MKECPKCGSRNILADRSCKPCGWRPLGPVPGSGDWDVERTHGRLCKQRKETNYMETPKSKRPARCSRPTCSPSLKPQRIDKDTWYYEYKNKIELVLWVTNPDTSRSCHTVFIPWRKLKKSAARCMANTKLAD